MTTVMIEVPEVESNVGQVKSSEKKQKKAGFDYASSPMLTDKPNSKEWTFQDKRFAELYAYALEVARQGGGIINHWQVTMEVGPLPAPEDREHLQMMFINGKWYSFTPCLKDRAAAGKDGLLGSFNTPWGIREVQEVAAREAAARKRAEEKAKKAAVWKQCRSNRNYARQECEKLWGSELADAAWEYNAKNSHPEAKIHKVVAITKVCLHYLSNADALEGKLPDFQGMLKNKILSRKITTRLESVWNQAKAMAEFIYRRVPVERAPEFYGKMPSTPEPPANVE